MASFVLNNNCFFFKLQVSGGGVQEILSGENEWDLAGKGLCFYNP